MRGATKEGEYQRTADLLLDIAEEQGLEYVLYLLADMQYAPSDMARVATILLERRGRNECR
jgi:hypothetical protein